jgi:hypothetical protein
VADVSNCGLIGFHFVVHRGDAIARQALDGGRLSPDLAVENRRLCSYKPTGQFK